MISPLRWNGLKLGTSICLWFRWSISATLYIFFWPSWLFSHLQNSVAKEWLILIHVCSSELNYNKMLPLQGVIRVFLNTVCMPYLNSRLGNGFVLPVVHGFTLQDVYVLTSAKQLTLCSDVTFTNASSMASLALLRYREARVF